MNKVYITKVEKENIKTATEFCLGEVLAEKIKTTDTVLIKPNFLESSPAETGITTDLRVIRALIDLLHEKGINRIILAEAGFSNTEKIFRDLKIYDLKNYGINVINLEKSEKITADFPSGSVLKKMVLPRPVIDSDVIISIPKLKTHCQTLVSLGIKNLFGFLYTPQRKIAHTVDLDKAIVDIYTYLKTILNKRMLSLVDAIWCLEGKLGPSIGNAVKMDLLVGGADLLSVDAVCVRIMGTEPRKARHLLLCEQTGLGNIEKQQIIGESINRIKKRFSIPETSATLFPQLTRVKEILFKKQPLIRHPDQCTACSICVNSCPKDCIKLNGNPVINYAECIGCLCCMEGCPNKVFVYKVRNHLLFIFLRKLYRLIKWIIKQE